MGNYFDPDYWQFTKSVKIMCQCIDLFMNWFYLDWQLALHIFLMPHMSICQVPRSSTALFKMQTIHRNTVHIRNIYYILRKSVSMPNCQNKCKQCGTDSILDLSGLAINSHGHAINYHLYTHPHLPTHMHNI